MDYRSIAGPLSTLVFFLATIPYIVATARKTIRPSVLAWFGGAVINAIVFTAQIISEPSWAVGLSGTSLVYCLLIAVFAWRSGLRITSRFEFTCLAIGVLAIVLWRTTGVAEWAIALSVVADLVLCLPMIVKTIRDPRSELSYPFLISTVAAIVDASAASHYNAVSLTWPIYVILINLTFGLLALRSDDAKVVSVA